jgi:hypothetical chaperone protein
VNPVRWVGLDFGTTNSAIAAASATGDPRLMGFATREGPRTTFPSVLYFEPRGKGTRQPPPIAGVPAIERYLDSEPKGRFIQSLKAFLPDRSFDGTAIGGQKYSLEKLIALIVKQMVDEIGDAWPAPRRVILGRPVHYSIDRDPELDGFAADRVAAAIRLAGIDEIVFEYEPVAAAYAYEQRLRSDERILIGDFGGGTSDFTIISVGPGVRSRGRRASDIVGNDGVALAGDAFDRGIVRHLVAPRLGLGGEFLSPPRNVLPVPSWPYERLERWHHLSFLKSAETLEMLSRVQHTAFVPERIEAFIFLIRNELGYQLHEAVRQAKFELSSRLETEFFFDSGPVTIRKTITRADFEGWISNELDAIATSVDRLIGASGLSFADIDRVFLTGGSSFVPAVRQMFIDRFGADKISGGEELTSVATGLALRAREQWAG